MRVRRYDREFCCGEQATGAKILLFLAVASALPSALKIGADAGTRLGWSGDSQLTLTAIPSRRTHSL
jgi:hypothetical protein